MSRALRMRRRRTHGAARHRRAPRQLQAGRLGLEPVLKGPEGSGSGAPATAVRFPERGGRNLLACSLVRAGWLVVRPPLLLQFTCTCLLQAVVGVHSYCEVLRAHTGSILCCDSGSCIVPSPQMASTSLAHSGYRVPTIVPCACYRTVSHCEASHKDSVVLRSVQIP